jgi:hypothetical protein
MYAANPNLIYLQATAMTEALYLALFIWAIVYFSEFVQKAENPGDEHHVRTVSSSLTKCGICLAAACLTRYDAWFLAVAMCAASIWVGMKAKHRGIGASARKFVVLAAAAPAFWLAYNAIVYRNPLEFANGPYSAKAIEARTPGASHPGSHDLPVAFSFFLKSAELNLAAGNGQKLWILLAVAGTMGCLIAGVVRPTSWRLPGGFPPRGEGQAPSEQPARRRRHGLARRWSAAVLRAFRCL